MRRQFPQRTGMLAVASVLPGTPSALALQPGDILLRINGRYVTTFDPLEETARLLGRAADPVGPRARRQAGVGEAARR